MTMQHVTVSRGLMSLPYAVVGEPGLDGFCGELNGPNDTEESLDLAGVVAIESRKVQLGFGVLLLASPNGTAAIAKAQFAPIADRHQQLVTGNSISPGRPPDVIRW
ncbi:hypothetical protein FDENT_3607 [Fusarium denticulatum]|uniref:Uncharacterized protein n=1 Tax=Fusarium denticulatum TaxID=48507 RepID=A0A8H6CT20_9HYPO|nr:hypothetical protein FDENT_3607 [Fusarium denticulatum]